MDVSAFGLFRSSNGLSMMLAVGLLVSACGTAGAAEFREPAAQPSEISSLTTWVNSCEATTDLQKKVVDATVFIVPESLLTSNGDGTWALDNEAFTSLTDPGNSTNPLCSNFPFTGEPAVPAGRSGFLVGPNRVMTAPHIVSYDPTHMRVITGLNSYKNTRGTCVMPDFNHIPDGKVYVPNGILLNGLSSSPASDYMVFTLTPKLSIKNALKPLRIRRNGSLEFGDQAFTVGYPYRLSAKVDLAAYFVDPLPVPFGPNPLPLGVGVAGAHMAVGNSGGPVFNIDKQMVEASAGYSFGNWDPTLDTTQSPACYAPGELMAPAWGVNLAIDSVSAQVPANELLVAPLAPVTYEAPIGTTVSPAVTSYTISAPLGISAPITYTVTAPQLTSPSPFPGAPPNITQSIAPGTYSLSQGQSTTLTITADASPVTACRRWTSAVDIVDVTNGWTDKIEHRFDIGTTEYAISPSDDVAFEEISPPYTNTTSYLLSNSRPVTVLVIVDAMVPWLEVTDQNGNHGSRVSVRLEPQGTPGDSAIIVAGVVSSEAELLTRHQTYEGQIRFAYGASSCAADATWRYRNISFHPGRHTYLTEWSQEGPILADSPSQGQYGDALSRSLDAISGGTFCVSSIIPEYGFLTENAIFVAPFPDLVGQLQLSLSSPTFGGVLWDMQPSNNPAYFYVQSFATPPSGFRIPVGVVHFEDGVSPPPVSSLSSFVGLKGDGQWTFALRDGVPGLGEIYPIFGRLQIVGEPGCALP